MSEKYTILSKEELLAGVSSVSGLPAERSYGSRSSSRSKRTSDRSSENEHKDDHKKEHHRKHKGTTIEAPSTTEKKPHNPKVRRIVCRAVLCFVVIVGLLLGGVSLLLNRVFNGPSPAARDTLTKSLLESGCTDWIPALFLGDEMVEQIKNSGSDLPGEEALDDADPAQLGGEE